MLAGPIVLCILRNLLTSAKFCAILCEFHLEGTVIAVGGVVDIDELDKFLHTPYIQMYWEFNTFGLTCHIPNTKV